MRVLPYGRALLEVVCGDMAKHSPFRSHSKQRLNTSCGWGVLLWRRAGWCVDNDIYRALSHMHAGKTSGTITPRARIVVQGARGSMARLELHSLGRPTAPCRPRPAVPGRRPCSAVPGGQPVPVQLSSTTLLRRQPASVGDPPQMFPEQLSLFRYS